MKKLIVTVLLSLLGSVTVYDPNGNPTRWTTDYNPLSGTTTYMDIENGRRVQIVPGGTWGGYIYTEKGQGRYTNDGMGNIRIYEPEGSYGFGDDE